MSATRSTSTKHCAPSETNKAAVEIPSPYAGRIVELGGAVGEVLAVGAVLVRIDIVAGSASPPEVAQSAKTNGAVRTPVLVGYGADVSFDSSRRERPRAKPGVRRLAAELLVDLSTLEPGPDGLISRAAVLAAAGVSGEARSGIAHDVLPVRGVHAEMAKRMALARNQIPDAHAAVQVDCTALLALRDRMRRSADDLAEQITPFVLTLRLLVIALTHHRIFNSTWVDGPGGPQVHTQHAIHLGFGVAAPRGLLVPVISDAQDRTTRELADVATRLTRAARRHPQTGGVGRLDVHRLELRCARSRRGCPGDQLPGGGDPRDGVAQAARRRRRRKPRRPPDDDPDVRVRPPHCRRRPGGPVPR